jgi:transcriptional regulator with XRE-family HTH domain
LGPWRRGISPAERLAVEHVAAIAMAIRGARSARFETQEQLAQVSGVSVATIVRVETGRSWPDLRTVWLLPGALNITEAPPPSP